jgi:hypothetical protein
MVHYL